MAKKGKKKKNESLVPLNLSFDKDNPEQKEVAELLETGFDLGLLSPASGSVKITEKKIIGTIALNRLLADLKEAKAGQQQTVQPRAGAQAQTEPSAEDLSSAPKKRSMTDFNQMMQPR